MRFLSPCFSFGRPCDFAWIERLSSYRSVSLIRRFSRTQPSCGGGNYRCRHVAGVEEVELAEVLDHCLLHAALEGEVELLQRLAGGEPGGLDPALAAVAVARGDLGAEQRFGEPFIAPGSSRARSASAGSARAAAGALSARNRCASSACLVMPGSARHSATAAGSRPRPGGADGAARAGARAGSDAPDRSGSARRRTRAGDGRRARRCPARPR